MKVKRRSDYNIYSPSNETNTQFQDDLFRSGDVILTSQSCDEFRKSSDVPSQTSKREILETKNQLMVAADDCYNSLSIPSHNLTVHTECETEIH